MPVTIDPNLRESKSSQRQPANAAQNFADFMGTVVEGAAPTAVEVASRGQGAVTSAAVTGVTGATNAYTQPMAGAGYSSIGGGNTPYYSGASLGTASMPGSATLSTQYTPTAGTFSWTVPGGTTTLGNGLTGSVAGVSSDTLAKQQLFQEMNDANWEMLVAQVTVNNLSRDYQARSNILKTKSDTEVSIARNYRG